MAIKFEFYESPNTIGTRKKRYHARVVNWQRINTDYLAREIQYGLLAHRGGHQGNHYLAQRETGLLLEGRCPGTYRRDRIFPYIAYLPRDTDTKLHTCQQGEIQIGDIPCGQIPEASVERRQDRAFEIQAALHAGNQREYRRSTDGILPDKQRADTPEV